MSGCFSDLGNLTCYTYPQPPGGQYLLARDGMDYGKVSLHANHHQDENRRRVAQRVHKLVHLAQEVTKYPTETRRNTEQILTFC